jgi:ubiquinone biosynthesis protein UbiJ
MEPQSLTEAAAAAQKDFHLKSHAKLIKDIALSSKD